MRITTENGLLRENAESNEAVIDRPVLTVEKIFFNNL